MGTQKLKKVPMGSRVPKWGPMWEQWDATATVLHFLKWTFHSSDVAHTIEVNEKLAVYVLVSQFQTSPDGQSHASRWRCPGGDRHTGPSSLSVPLLPHGAPFGEKAPIGYLFSFWGLHLVPIFFFRLENVWKVVQPLSNVMNESHASLSVIASLLHIRY